MHYSMPVGKLIRILIDSSGSMCNNVSKNGVMDMLRLLADKDKKLILDYHERNEIETSFFYSNVIEFGVDNKKDMRRCGDYFGWFEDGSLRGVIAFYNLGSCIPHYESDEAIPYFIALMKDRSFDILMGMERVIKPLYRELEGLREVIENNESGFFINRGFKPYISSGLEFLNPCEAVHDEKVIEFIIHARFKGFHENADREGVIKMLSQTGSGEDKVIAVSAGKPVAYAGIQANTASTSQIGSVFTLEEERGKGYCKAIVSELCSRIVSRGKIPTLFARKNNTPAVRAYNALGFKYTDDYSLIKFRQEET